MKLSRWWTLYVLSIGGMGAIGALTHSGGADAVGGCSSTKEQDAGTPVGSGSSGGTMSSGSSGSGGGMCTPPTGCTAAMHQTVAAKVTLDSTWPPQTAIAGCDKTSCTADQRKVSQLYAIDYDIDSSTNTYKGTFRLCQNQLPPIPLSALGSSASGVPAGSKVQVVIDSTVWDKQKPVNATGSVANGAFTMDSVVALNGLDPNSKWKDPTLMWAPISPNPNSDPAIPTSDWNNDDMNPNGGGITAAFRADMMPFIIPKVALNMSAPQTDKIFVVARTQIQLSGCMMTCTDGQGTASVPLLENHTIGCHIPSTDAGVSERACTPAEYNYIDQNATAYCADPNAACAAQLTPDQKGAIGTFQLKVVSGTTCKDVSAAFPM
jgi:hypothetical protein